LLGKAQRTNWCKILLYWPFCNTNLGTFTFTWTIFQFHNYTMFLIHSTTEEMAVQVMYKTYVRSKADSWTAREWRHLVFSSKFVSQSTYICYMIGFFPRFETCLNIFFKLLRKVTRLPRVIPITNYVYNYCHLHVGKWLWMYPFNAHGVPFVRLYFVRFAFSLGNQWTVLYVYILNTQTREA
jgi:hypothetical protein